MPRESGASSNHQNSERPHAQANTGSSAGAGDDGQIDRTGKGYDGPSARSLKRWILPVAVFGSSLRNSIQRGYL
jgi:hypothetical protein